MRRTLGSEGNPFSNKLSAGLTFSDNEKAAIAALVIQISDLRAGQDLVRQGDEPTRSFLLLEGFTCSYKVMRSGKRQIVGIDVPGDIPDLQSLYLTSLDVTVSTLTESRIGFVSHDTIHEICQGFPRIGAALWRETLVNAAIFREWVTIVGQLAGPSRLSHLLCEIFVRLKTVGLTDGESCAFPLTQVQMGEAVGLSSVHVNRSLQELRSKGLIRLEGKRLEILNWKRLTETAEFDPAYLQLRHRRSRAWPWSSE